MKGSKEIFIRVLFYSRKGCGTILYFLGIISALFFMIWKWPEVAPWFSWVLLTVIIVFIISHVFRSNFRLYNQGVLSKGRFVVKTIFETIGALLIAFITIILAGALANYAAETIGKAVETSMPGLGLPAGMFSGLFSAAIVGLAIGYFTRALWGSFIKAINTKTHVIERED